MSISIATHNGFYHSDDLFAVATIGLYLGDDVNLEIIRTRDERVIASADFVVDVGGEFNPDKKIFDHHQEGGGGVRPNGVPYAAFGLVWKTYGEKITGDRRIAEKVDRRIVQPIDSEDNGVKVASEVFEEISPYTIQDMFFAFAPTWKEEDTNIDAIFESCVNIAKRILKREMKMIYSVTLAESFVESFYKNTEDKRVIVLDQYYPWKVVMLGYPEPLYVVYPGSSGETWHVHAVPKKKNSLDVRLSFPEEWAGKSYEELAELSGVSDALFTHNKRFLSVAKSKEGAEQLAWKAIEQFNEKQ